MSDTSPRHDFVDYSKGICIVLVVLMHATLGVEKAVGTETSLHAFIDWARPFRMPDFFFISGLFLASRIERPWRAYLDAKLVHFAYFYLLWLTIQLLFRAPMLALDGGPVAIPQAWLMGLVEPYGTLWFIYMLAVFFVVIKVVEPVPPLLVFVAGALWQMSHVETGWLVVDEFAARFVYIYAGYRLAPAVFDFARSLAARPVAVTLLGLASWAMVNATLVANGCAKAPGVGLLLGFTGTAAVIAMGVLLAKSRLAAPLRFCGANSIVIYLAFSLFMASARGVLLHGGLADDPAAVALLATLAGVAGPLLLHRVVRGTRIAFLFRRPAWARVALPAMAQSSPSRSRHAGPVIADSRRGVRVAGELRLTTRGG
jgi:uncharacterized membrane protein YcfT